MAQDCLSVLCDHNDVDLRLLVGESPTDTAQRRLGAYCDERDVHTLFTNRKVNDTEVVAAITAEKPDLILSISNFQVVGRDLLELPTIGAINGWALGGGTELTLCLDIRIAADTARFGLPEITLGIFPGAGGTQRIQRQMPLCQAKELMFTGTHVTAQQAVEIGLINRVVPKDGLMDDVMETARNIAAKSPLVLKLLKRTVGDGGDMPMPAAIAHEQAMISLVFDSEDAHEGTAAFLEKRAPKFSGR